MKGILLFSAVVFSTLEALNTASVTNWRTNLSAEEGQLQQSNKRDILPFPLPNILREKIHLWLP